jgi:hypothetical protein
MVIHPGQNHSTSDVFDGMCAGLTWAGVEVVPFAWGEMLRPFTAMANAAIKHETFTDAEAQRMHEFCMFVASADAVTVALDNAVDAVIVVNGLMFPPSRVEVLRKLNIPVVCFGTESPYFDTHERAIAPAYSHWFTNERTSVARFADLTRAFYLPHAWNPVTHQLCATDPDKACDVTFVGGGFPERKRLLAGVDWTGINHTIHGTLWGLDLDAEHGASDFARGDRWTEGAIPNDHTSAWHRSAKVALNLHRQMGTIEGGEVVSAGSESLGPRAYEIPAVGGFMLIDDERPEVRDVYGDSAATFRAWDSASLRRELRYWLTHDDARERAQQAQHEAVQPHHWGLRAKYILETIMD